MCQDPNSNTAANYASTETHRPLPTALLPSTASPGRPLSTFVRLPAPLEASWGTTSIEFIRSIHRPRICPPRPAAGPPAASVPASPCDPHLKPCGPLLPWPVNSPPPLTSTAPFTRHPSCPTPRYSPARPFAIPPGLSAAFTRLCQPLIGSVHLPIPSLLSPPPRAVEGPPRRPRLCAGPPCPGPRPPLHSSVIHFPHRPAFPTPASVAPLPRSACVFVRLHDTYLRLE